MCAVAPLRKDELRPLACAYDLLAARELTKAGKGRESLPLLWRAHEIWPGNAAYMLGETMLMQNRPAEAVPHLRNCLAHESASDLETQRYRIWPGQLSSRVTTRGSTKLLRVPQKFPLTSARAKVVLGAVSR